MIRKFGGLLLLVLILIITSGCTRYISDSAQGNLTSYIHIDHQKTLGQTFTARFDGLAGVGLILKPAETGPSPGAGEMILHLRSDPQSDQDLRTASFPVQKIKDGGNYRFFFQPLPDSNQQDYYLLLEMKATGEIEVGVAGVETYLDGSVHQNGIAEEGQLTFSLKYDSTSLYTGLIKEVMQWLVWLFISLFIFTLPGWALLSLTWSGWNNLDFWEKISLGSGASLAIYPVLFLWTNLVGLHLGVIYAWLPALLGLVALVWRNYRVIFRRVSLRFNRNSHTPEVISDNQTPEISISHQDQSKTNDVEVTTPSSVLHIFSVESLNDAASKAAMVFLVGVIIFSRIWVIRSLDFPLWGDSYQHTMISQLIVDNNGLFHSWLPYAELSTFTYHFGFHSLVACFNWISGLPMEKATLWVGQIVNILAVISLYPLTRKLSRNRWSGVALLLIAGLISPMPMSYVNWGRYTQLAGQAMLPTAVYCTWILLQSKQISRSALVANWIILGGVALTHYRVLIFLLLFVMAVFIVNFRLRAFTQLVQRIFLIGAGGVLFFLPWLLAITPYKMIQNFLMQITTAPSQTSKFLVLDYNSLSNPFEFFSPLIWFSLLIIMGWAIWRRKTDFATIFIWWFLIFGAANPYFFGLPGAGVLNNFAVQISLYIPFGILIGAALAQLIAFLNNQLNQTKYFGSSLRTSAVITLSALILAGVIALAISLTSQRLDDIKPSRFTLMTRPDEQAMVWIQQNTNPADRFLVNSFFAYGGTVITGSDGGWWLPFLTKRLSTQPPLNYSVEEGPEAGYTDHINELAKTIGEKGLSNPETMDLLQKHGINFVYTGQQQGRVNSPKPLLDLNSLKVSPHFQLVYHQDQVWIFKITK